MLKKCKSEALKAVDFVVVVVVVDVAVIVADFAVVVNVDVVALLVVTGHIIFSCGP